MRRLAPTALLLTLAAACTADIDSSEDFAAANTEDYYACTVGDAAPLVDNKGNWGEIGTWCDPAALEEAEIADDVASLVEARYPGLIIPARKSKWSTRKPILAKLVKTITVSSHIAADRRGLRAEWGADESKSFVLTALSTIYQQSYFGHYKKVDGKLKLMRAGEGHQHGLMQINDRYHDEALFEGGASWDLLTNLDYGLGLLLDAREIALSKKDAGEASCITDDGLALARATYSIYVSGQPSKVCRWKTAPTTSDDYFLKRWNEVSNEANLTKYEWVLDYDAALAGVGDIDFEGILDVDLPGEGSDDDGPTEPKPDPQICDDPADPAGGTIDEAQDLGGISDCDVNHGASVTASLTGKTDVDWYTTWAPDSVTCGINPHIEINTGGAEVEVCQYVECTHDNATSTQPEITCPDGTTEATHGDLVGCCGTGSFDIGGYNCVGTWSDDTRLYVSVTPKMNQDVCVAYDLNLQL